MNYKGRAVEEGWVATCIPAIPRGFCFPGEKRLLAVTASLILLFAASLVYGEDTYLRALEDEANKVVAPAAADSNDTPVPASPERNPAGDSAQQEFETLLQERFRGTHVFYKELPANVQQEFADEFARGTPVAELREKIVDRYLQR